jgi:hypothetical protein
MLRVVIFALIWRIRLWVVPKCSLRLWKKGVPAIWFAFVSVDACTDDAIPAHARGDFLSFGLCCAFCSRPTHSDGEAKGTLGTWNVLRGWMHRVLGRLQTSLSI